tara:strand:- start:101 stop:490 length:390 start_codon:yes stop_codon:yes gene_type:complete
MKSLNDIFQLTPTRKPKSNNPITFRREKLIRNINKQLKNIDDTKLGKRTYNNWFWINEDNKFHLSIKYGKQEIELSKNKFSIICENLDEVETSLTKIKELTYSGQFDLILTEMSKEIRSNFKRSKPTTS